MAGPVWYAVAKAALWLLALFSTFTATTRIPWITKRLDPECQNALRRRLPPSRRALRPLLCSVGPGTKAASKATAAIHASIRR